MFLCHRGIFLRSYRRQFCSGRDSGSSGPITLAYQHRVDIGAIRADADQLSTAGVLDSLYSTLLVSSGIAIADEHIEIAARYYDVNSSISRLKLLLSLSGGGNRSGGESSNFVGVANAAVHSCWSTMRSKLSLNRLDATIEEGVSTGIYIHGSVGTGKSMLMDLFYCICANGYTQLKEENPNEKATTIPTSAKHSAVVGASNSYPHIKIKHKRLHFHEFMLHTHQCIHSYKLKNPKSDPIPHVAAVLAREARLLCFDEMQITDIADAMIMKRLFTILFDLGVVIVTTSNRPPRGLYEGGINRSIFKPFIDTLYERMQVIEMVGMHDYRKDNRLDPVSQSSADSLPLYLYPSSSPSTRKILEKWTIAKLGTIGSDAAKAGETLRSETIPVPMGRMLHVKRANKHCGWFTFDELCKQPLGAADYIAISHRFDTIFIENVPQLGGHIYNEARRFVTLIDALYESQTRLVIAADVPRENLFLGFDADVETHDGDEEIAIDDGDSDAGGSSIIKTRDMHDNRESIVVGEGGSSSSLSTTMIQVPTTDDSGGDGVMEWSATGRIGVSLAQLSAVREVSFSFQRAESRLIEMTSLNWGR